MKRIVINNLSDKLQNLIKEVSELAQKEIIINFENERTTPYIELSQSEHKVSGNVINIEIKNSPNIEYMIAHELFHIKLDYSDFTKLNFNLYSSDANFNQQAQATAVSLKTVIDHRLIKNWELSNEFITTDIQESINYGAKEMLAADEVNASDEQLILYRTLIMLDNDIYDSKYITANDLAKRLNEVIGDIQNSTQHHSALVRLFNTFDGNVKNIGYIDLMHNQFTTLTPIFSKRQLRLEVNQIFEVLHTEFVNKQNTHPYILLTKNNNQNAGIIEIPVNKQIPDFFKELYSMTLLDFLDSYHIEYLLR
ncbi:hypothetical protein [Companilactobacillus sp. DQM5]|uniref:hypothetical protein n=1 Tax=Companilactobacillus sp. DQM5 TaxID=3463359 RepID=UPI004059CE8B